MTTETDLGAFLSGATIAPAVAELRGDYRVLLLAADGLEPEAPGAVADPFAEALLVRAEASAVRALAERSVEELPHVAAWREAYRAFGAKPQRTRNSVEALLRRAATGLPRVNRLTDVYNAVSVLHQIPLGGEDLGHYVGPLRLVRAVGTEPFPTTANGVPVVEHPEVGEVVWRDDEGVTCRRWNWRQGPRTALTPATTTALFILDALDPLTDDELHAAGDDLAEHLSHLGSAVRVVRRLVGRGEPVD
ncbi:MAG TPA: phenylalanine--tRNA ligase beta subunit-related protein [Friedmanniella sp.]